MVSIALGGKSSCLCSIVSGPGSLCWKRDYSIMVATKSTDQALTTKDRINPLQPPVRDAMLAAVPSLRAFAISLCGKVDRADDLVQETLLRAIGNINSFQPGTNMCAWLLTILRNLFRSEYRKRRREVQDTDGSYLDSLKS